MMPAFSRAISVRLVAEPFLVIVIDRGEDGDDRLGGVGRVEASAHPGLEHNDLRFRISEMIERESGGNFEEGRMRFPSRDQLTNFRQAAHHLVFGNQLAIHLNALAKADEMRRSEKRGAIARGAAD